MINKIKNVKNIGIIAGAGILTTGILSTVVIMKAKKRKDKISSEAQQVVTQEKTVEVLEKISKDLDDIKDNVKKNSSKGKN